MKAKKTCVSEPAIQYGVDSANSNTLNISKYDGISPEMREKGYMTVSEYFDKVKKALDLRYENLQSNI